MTEIINKLAVIGVEMSEEDRVVHLLASLPKSYNTLVTALEASPDVPKNGCRYREAALSRKQARVASRILKKRCRLITGIAKENKDQLRCHFCH